MRIFLESGISALRYADVKSIVAVALPSRAAIAAMANTDAVFTVGDAKPRYQQDGGQGRPSSGSASGEGAEGTPRRKFLGLF